LTKKKKHVGYDDDLSTSYWIPINHKILHRKMHIGGSATLSGEPSNTLRSTKQSLTLLPGLISELL
jgi:hypothetical protein